MNWLKRIWSKIWVEQHTNPIRSSPELSRDQLIVGEKFVLETDLFHWVFSEKWRRIEVDNSKQYCFHHDESDIGLVISFMRVDLPHDKMRPLAEVLLKSIQDALIKTRDTRDVVQSDDVITEQSWGFQASILRVYCDNEICRFFGFVSPLVTLNVTFESKLTARNSFETEVETVLASLKFSDEVWGGREFPEGRQLH